MVNSESSIQHDHDYCSTIVTDEQDVDFVVENLINSSFPILSMEAESTKKLETPCPSPAYSCDSGIDPLTNELLPNFVGDELLNFLFEDDFELEMSELERSMKLSTNCNSSVKTTTLEKGASKTANGLVNNKLTEGIGYDRSRKNAENARENRKRKKMYIEGLEKEVAQLRNEKDVLTRKTATLEEKTDELQNEVDYLKSILANQSMLSKLITNVSKTPGVSLSTSFCSSRDLSLKDNDESLLTGCIEQETENTVSTRSSRKRACDSQPLVSSAKRGRGSSLSSGGVCLHVKERKVSIEFCHRCSKVAQD